MILGILSDTHGKYKRAVAAVELLRQVGADALLHCGDLGDERIFDAMAGMQAWFIWGNNDQPDPLLERYAYTLGVRPARSMPLELTLDNRVIRVFHGHEPGFARLLNRLEAPGEIAGGRPDYVVHGHTHAPDDYRIGSTRIINPGALHRATRYTVATLDLACDELLFWEVRKRTDDPHPVPIDLTR